MIVRSVIGSSLRFRFLVIGIAVGLMAVGIAQLRSAPVDALPEFTPPYVEVQTESLGLSAEEVEQLITVPLEADLLNGVQGIDVIRSKSVPGLSDVVMVFDDETGLYQARQLVQERLIGVVGLPNVSKPPTMIQPLSSSSRVMMIGLDPKQVSPIEASVLARWTVKPRLLGVPGVANVAIWGMRDRQLQVLVRPDQLENRGVTLSQVIETAGNAQLVSPLSFLEASTPGTGGFIETPNQRLQVRHDFGQLTTPEGLGQVPVDGTGGRMRLDDVASVVVDHQPLIGNAIVNGGDGLLLVVEKFPGADTARVAAGVQDALDKLQPGLSGVKVDSGAFGPATYIQGAIRNLTLALIIACILLALGLAAFLFQWRTVLISLIVIPLSLVAAAFVVHLLGQTFNAILFAGLAVAIAVVIDDAVAGVHEVSRRLREHRRTGSERSRAEVVLESSIEVRSPIMYATFIALLAVVPVLVIDDVRLGAFFKPLAFSYMLAVVASMVVALTVTPALALLLFSSGSPGRRESPILRWLGPRYDGALSRSLRAPRAALIACGVLVAAGLVALPLIEASPVPSLRDRDVLVRLESPSGTSEPKMSATTARLAAELKAMRGVEDVGAIVGRAVTGSQIVDVNSSELSVRIAPDADYDATMASIKAAADSLPDVHSSVGTYFDQAIRNVGALYTGEQPKPGNGLDVLTGVNEPLVVRLYGPDPDVLRSEAEKVRGLVSGVDGVANPHIQLDNEEPVLDVETDLSRALHYGIKPGDVRRAEAALVQGIQVGSIFRQQKVFDVVVKGEPSVRQNVASVRNMLIDTPGGGDVRLGQVADVRMGSAPTVIERDAVSRFVDVKANISGRSLGAVSSDVEARLANAEFPLEYHAEVRQASTNRDVGLAFVVFGIVVAIAIFLVLQAALRSWRLAALAYLTLPVGLAGGVLAALFNGAVFSLGALIAFLAILGLAARNGIMLLHHCQRLRLDEGHPFGADLVRQVAAERLAPILTTASAVALVTLPFVIMGNVAGLEIVHPMAIVMLGGLVTSTLLGLFALPALYLRFGAGTQPSLAPEEVPMHWRDVPEPAPAGGDGRAAQRQAPSVTSHGKDGGNGSGRQDV